MKRYGLYFLASVVAFLLLDGRVVTPDKTWADLGRSSLCLSARVSS